MRRFLAVSTILALFIILSSCWTPDVEPPPPIPTEPPPAPIDCWRDQGDLSIILIYWQYDPADFDLVDNFAIRRKEEGSDEWETIAEPEPDTGTAYQQYEDDSAECDVTYYYRIYAVNSAGYSDYCPLSAIRNCE